MIIKNCWSLFEFHFFFGTLWLLLIYGMMMSLQNVVNVGVVLVVVFFILGLHKMYLYFNFTKPKEINSKKMFKAKYGKYISRYAHIFI